MVKYNMFCTLAKLKLNYNCTIIFSIQFCTSVMMMIDAVDRHAVLVHHHHPGHILRHLDPLQHLHQSSVTVEDLKENFSTENTNPTGFAIVIFCWLSSLLSCIPSL